MGLVHPRSRSIFQRRMVFDRFIRKQLKGLRLLRISSEQYGVGAILDHKSLRKVGNLRQVLTSDKIDWSITKSDANIIYGSVDGSRKLGSGVRLLGLLRISGAVSSEYAVHYEITEIKGAEFTHLSQLLLYPKILELRESNKAAWKVVNDRLLVTEAFYASTFNASFTRSGKVVIKADIEHRIKLEGDVDYDWIDDQHLQIAGNENIPFGVRGFYV